MDAPLTSAARSTKTAEKVATMRLSFIIPDERTASLAAALFLLPAFAFADVPLPSLFGFIAPFWVGVRTLGVALGLVILLEAAVVARRSGTGFRRSLAAMALANLASTLVGFLAVSGILGLLGLFIAMPYLFGTFQKRWKVSQPVAIALAIAPLALCILWYALTFPFGHGIERWALVGSLAPAFVASVIIEAAAARRLIPAPPAPVFAKSVVIANGYSYAILLIYLLFFPLTSNPLNSPDYFGMWAEYAAEHGDLDRAIQLVDQGHQHLDRPGWYLLAKELKVARALAAHGRPDDAARLVDRIEESLRQHPEDGLGITDEIPGVRKQIEHARSTTPPVLGENHPSRQEKP